MNLVQYCIGFQRIVTSVVLLAAIFILCGSTLHAQKCSIAVTPTHAGACCYDFELVHSDPNLVVSVITANLISGNAVVDDATGPPAFTPTHTPTAANWGIAGGWSNGSTDTVRVCFTNTGSPLIIEFVYRDQAGGVGCRDTVSVECPLPPQGCVSFSNSEIICAPAQGGGVAYKFTFDLTNERNCTLTNASFSVIQPGGVTVTTPTTVFDSPLAPNGGTALRITKTFTGASLLQSTTMKLVVSASGPAQGCQCSDTVTVILPLCSQGCFELKPKGVNCDSLPGGQRAFAWNFDITNLLNCSITSMRCRVLSPANVVAAPSPLVFPSPVTTGSLYTNGKIRLSGAGATEGSIVSLAVTVSGPDEFCSCTDTVQVVLPFCDGTVQCFDLASGSVLCNGVASHLYSFRLVNRMNCGVTGGTLSVISPAGVSVAPQMVSWKTAVATGDTTPLSQVTLRGTKAGDTVRLMVGTIGPGQNCSCVDTITVVIPVCPPNNGCSEIVSRRVECEPGAGPRRTYLYVFDMINRSQRRIDSIRFEISPTAGDPQPTFIRLATPVNPGGQATGLQMRVENALPGELPMKIYSVDSTGYACYDTLRLTLPDCPIGGVDRSSPGDADLALAILPNPARDQMTISFRLPSPAKDVSLVLVDAVGREILRPVVSTAMPAGDHLIHVDTRDLASGSYQVILRVGGMGGVRNATVQIVR